MVSIPEEAEITEAAKPYITSNEAIQAVSFTAEEHCFALCPKNMGGKESKKNLRGKVLSLHCSHSTLLFRFVNSSSPSLVAMAKTLHDARCGDVVLDT